MERGEAKYARLGWRKSYCISAAWENNAPQGRVAWWPNRVTGRTSRCVLKIATEETKCRRRHARSSWAERTIEGKGEIGGEDEVVVEVEVEAGQWRPSLGALGGWRRAVKNGGSL